MKRIGAVWLLAAALVPGPAGCGSAPTTATSPAARPGVAASPSTQTKALAKRVLAVLADGNAAVQTAMTLGNDASTYKAVSRVFSTAATKLEALPFPATEAADAKALEASLEKLSRDASLLAAAGDTATASPLLSQIARDESTETAAANALLHDLGLTPTK